MSDGLRPVIDHEEGLLIHGGGNFHLSGADGPAGIPDAYATELRTALYRGLHPTRQE